MGIDWSSTPPLLEASGSSGGPSPGGEEGALASYARAIRSHWLVATTVFVALPLQIDARLKAAGASYHPWTTDSLPNGVALARDVTLVRLVTSFATTADEVDRFVAFAGAF